MAQKCSLLKVLEIFFIEPTSIHFIKAISKKINLASTSVRIPVNAPLKAGVIAARTFSKRNIDGCGARDIATHNNPKSPPYTFTIMYFRSQGCS